MVGSTGILGSINDLSYSLAEITEAARDVPSASEDFPQVGSQVRLSPEAMPGSRKTMATSSAAVGLGIGGGTLLIIAIGAWLLWS